jgi:hypothetical protein
VQWLLLMPLAITADSLPSNTAASKLHALTAVSTRAAQQHSIAACAAVHHALHSSSKDRSQQQLRNQGMTSHDNCCCFARLARIQPPAWCLHHPETLLGVPTAGAGTT